ncbi:MAG: class I tRNA ligase family protein [Candidatus Hodarchaeota archaeon]
MSEQQQQSIVELFEILKSTMRKWPKGRQKDDIFERIVDTTKKKHLITVPCPYTSEPFHVGYPRAYMLRDLFCRLKRQQGLNTLWLMAFHITGMPILSVSTKIKTGVIFKKNYI